MFPDAVVVADSRALLYESQKLFGLELDDLCDFPLLDEEGVGVVHVESHGLEQVSDLRAGLYLGVDSELVLGLLCADHSLDDDLVVLLVAHGRLGLVLVAEDDRDLRLVDLSLSFVVDEFSRVLHPREFGALQGKSQGEEDRLEDVGLPRSVLSGQGVELRIEVLEHRLVGVGLEPFYNQLFDFHYKILIKTNWIVNSFDRSN